MKKLFGTDGIRGRAPEGMPLSLSESIKPSGECLVTPALARAVGFCAARELLPLGECQFLIACDTRASSAALVKGISHGIRSAGGRVLLAGDGLPILPTPALATLCAQRGRLGVMITASHNPFDFNGIKLLGRNGEKISDRVENAIEKAISDMVSSGKEPWGEPIFEEELLPLAAEEYCRRLTDSILSSGLYESGGSEGLSIAVDCANGAAYQVARRVIQALPEGLVSSAFYMNVYPDGYNINKDCGATHLEPLASAVKEKGLDLGIALDGDGDRCIAINSRGEILDGDMILALLAEGMQKKGLLVPPIAVGTEVSGGGLAPYLKSIGVDFLESAVGDRNLYLKMKQSGALIGAESSGHLISRGLLETGDGLLTAALLICIGAANKAQKKNAPPLSRPYTPYERVSINLPTDAAFLYAFRELTKTHGLPEALKSIISQEEKTRIIIRPSGTEPLIRIITEAQNHAEALRVAEEIKGTLVLLMERPSPT